MLDVFVHLPALRATSLPPANEVQVVTVVRAIARVRSLAAAALGTKPDAGSTAGTLLFCHDSLLWLLPILLCHSPSLKTTETT